MTEDRERGVGVDGGAGVGAGVGVDGGGGGRGWGRGGGGCGAVRKAEAGLMETAEKTETRIASSTSQFPVPEERRLGLSW